MKYFPNAITFFHKYYEKKTTITKGVLHWPLENLGWGLIKIIRDYRKL